MICSCCHEDKRSKDFTHSGKRGYADKCKSCGVWLRLFAAAFGPSRKWHENRAKTTERMRSQRSFNKDAQVKPSADLYVAFGIQLPREKVTMNIKTVLAAAPWPYGRAA